MAFAPIMWFIVAVVQLTGALPLDRPLKYDFAPDCEPIAAATAEHVRTSNLDIIRANFYEGIDMHEFEKLKRARDEYERDRFRDSFEMAVQNNTLVSERAKAALHLGLSESVLNSTVRAVGTLSTEAGEWDQRIQTINTTLTDMEAPKANVRLEVVEARDETGKQKVNSLTVELSAICAKLDNFIQGVKNNIDETATANSIMSAMGEAGDQEGFVKALLETVEIILNHQYNIMIFHAGINYEENFEDIKFFRSFKYGTTTFFVWAFKGYGLFRNKGEGGWRNWAFNGYRDDKTSPCFVVFHKRP